MKTETSPVIDPLNQKLRPILMMAGIATSLCLSACVDPYASYGGGSSISANYYQPGYRVQSLPGGYRSENISGTTYYYQSGNYYRRSSGGYVVAEAPRSSRYYQEYGQMRQGRSSDHRQDAYARDRHDHGSDRGNTFNQLPYGARAVNVRGREYYQVGDRFYIRHNGAYSLVNRPY